MQNLSNCKPTSTQCLKKRNNKMTNKLGEMSSLFLFETFTKEIIERIPQKNERIAIECIRAHVL